MSYEKRTDISVEVGEQAVKLSDGPLAAVLYTRTVSEGRIQHYARARVIDGTGATLLAGDGTPLVRELQHSDIAADRADAVARDCLLAVMGEPVELVAWPPEYLLSKSIRQAAALSSITSGAVDAASAL
ncbi:hypothetical protein Xmar_07690 [Xanthomonas axonopodis pv. martyniicola]|uniref:hypothetical protein n=1 Tax=Xanthomonas axonopodis TaxID=53413 RepID=UPI0009976840|nr:hypothetical protein [Xanthomonas axonopodis]OOW67085.1 hypothetical protein Xmar_07690 [Xanthomonas axonopodis pv. martyniicola]OOW90162.1 hypothetical protein Xvtr_19145 [Xanthomonas campestris pv. vitiscarnosae]